MNTTPVPPERRLLRMLTIKRPHDSIAENDWVDYWLLNTLTAYKPRLLGPMENIVVEIGESDTLFSSHTDTVHWKDGVQKIMYDSSLGLVYKDDNECLGADDTTGVWLMREMILASVPGTYVFHRGEERGGIGSRWIATNEKEWLRKFKRAIAFDRKGTSSIITSQRGSQCCSDDFANELASRFGGSWKPDPTGSFTDTANYTALIPECTNLSIGYDRQHTREETQDVTFALEMRELCLAMDWDTLPAVREAKEETFGNFQSWRNNRSSRRSNYFSDFDRQFDFGFGSSNRPTSVSAASTAPAMSTESANDVEGDISLSLDLSDDQIRDMEYDDLVSACTEDPLFAANKIFDLIDDKDILEFRASQHEARIVDLEQQLADLQEDLAGLEEEVKLREQLIGKLRAERKPILDRFFPRSEKTTH